MQSQDNCSCCGCIIRKILFEKKLGSTIIKESVIFHGFIAPNEIDRIADECHFAINSLNLHKIRIIIASTLKSREYFARGIPFVTSSSDNDFDDNNPFILKVSGDDNPIDIHNLIEYAQELNASPDHPEKMRQYAIEHLEWSIKMKKLDIFFNEVCKDMH